MSSQGDIVTKPLSGSVLGYYLRDASDRTRFLKEKAIYVERSGVTDPNNISKGVTPSPYWTVTSNTYRLSYLFGKSKCNCTSGDPFGGKNSVAGV
jgi:hypothetical protein